VEDLDRFAIALDPALDGVYEPTRRGDMRADQHCGPPFVPVIATFVCFGPDAAATLPLKVSQLIAF
jgi:hypothetical protein